MASSSRSSVPAPPLAIVPAVQSLSSSVNVPPPPPPQSLIVGDFTAKHKNQLQEFALRSGMEVPVYVTVNEGHPHAPKFRSTVTVDGLNFTSELTFLHRKAAEQEAARLALEFLSKKIKEDGYNFIYENFTLCKSILNEYAAKLNIDKPKYNTVKQEGLLPAFTSSLIFNGVIYNGNCARNKKDAEQSAAHTAVLSILGNSDKGIMFFQMINTKAKFYGAKGSRPICAIGVLPIANTADSSHKDKEVTVGEAHQNKEIADSVGDTNNAIISTCQQSQLTKQKPASKATEPSNGSQQQHTVLPIENVSSSKKRRKDQYKANKRARLQYELTVAGSGIPVNQTPCSLAQ